MQYYMPTKIIFGRLEKNLKKEVDLFNPKKILLICGQTMKNLGLVDKVLNILSGYNVFVFDQVTQKPTSQLAEVAKRETNLILGLGGGSVLDIAKVVASELKQPFFAIPTTAGTGSEVTPFAAFYDIENKKKISLTPGFPTVALIDYKLTLTLPKDQVATTGLDALSQAIEAFWSIYSSPLSDIHAQAAIKLILANLTDSWYGNETAREKMALAALEAGLAFSQTKTTAVHSVSYPFSIYYDLPHGFACALTLPYFLSYNYQVTEKDCLDRRGPNFVKSRMEELFGFFGVKTADNAKEKILNLMKSIKAPIQANFDVDLIIKGGFSPERVANNPRKVTEYELKKILKFIKK